MAQQSSVHQPKAVSVCDWQPEPVELRVLVQKGGESRTPTASATLSDHGFNQPQISKKTTQTKKLIYVQFVPTLYLSMKNTVT